jgi:molybdenum cofactor cytidylyltransferase
MGGEHKLLLPFGDAPLIRLSVETALGLGLVRTAVITGRGAREVEKALHGLPVDLVENARFAEGLATSVTRAIEWAEPIADGLILLLGDEPGVDRAVIRCAIDAWARAPTRPLRVEYADRPGHPVILPLPTAPGARPSGDIGMRELLADARRLPIDAPAPIDVDTENDYHEALARLRQ